MKFVKKLTALFIAVVMVLGVCVAGLTTSAEDEIATVSDGISFNKSKNCYEISDYAGLKTFAGIVNGVSNPDNLSNPQSACAILTADIDASASDPDAEGYAAADAWTPIGNNNNWYTGIFDGDGHKITGLTYNNPEQIYAGLFGFVKGVKDSENKVIGGIVKNTGLEGGKITAADYVGGVAGHNYGGTITNCYNTGSVTAEESCSYAGGVAGYNYEGSVTNCYNTGNVKAIKFGAFAGGVAGYNDGAITNCYNTGNVTADGGGAFAGGVAGDNDGGTVTNCYNTGSITADKESACAGGVAGYNSGGKVTNCYNTGSVKADGDHTLAGGVAGYNYNDTVTNCYNTGSVKADGSDAKVGGVAGYNNGGTVTNCYNTGSITAEESDFFAGGVAGYNGGTVTNCYYDSSVCNVSRAIGDGPGKNVTGLTKEAMTSGTYTGGAVSNMPGFKAWSAGSADEDAVWLVRESDDFYSYYPHLAGFDTDAQGSQLPAENIRKTEWPARAAKDGVTEISDYNELKAFASAVNDGSTDLKGILIKNIDASASATANDWTPIGHYFDRYTGTFDGDGHIITGLCFNISYENYAGLFGYVGTDGKVQNVGLEGGKITAADYVGGVVGENDGTVTNCYNTGSVNADGSDVKAGGVAGYNNGGKVTNCYNTGSISAEGIDSYAGGVAGLNVSGKVTNCYNTGSITAEGFASYAGGVVGYLYSGTIANCYYNESVCGKIGAVDGEDTATVTGLTTDEMTGETALENMKFEYKDGETNPWLVKANDSDYSYYPHLKGFDYETNPTAGNWPPKIMKEDPGMELTIDPEKTAWDEDFTITATLPESATGTVTFRLDEADTGETVTVENGKAVYAIEGKSIEVSDYTVLASYSGDERYNSVSEELPFAVDKAETEVQITVEPENPVYGQEISITATVDGDANIINFTDHGLASNSVGGATLFIDGGEIDTLASETNTVTFNIPNLDAGEHTIKVVYNGDEHYYSAKSETVTINIGRAEPEMKVTVTPENPVCGDDVTITATLPGDAEGAVLFKIEGTDNDYGCSEPGINVSEGVAFTTVTLPRGKYRITAEYSGDDNYAAASADSELQVNHDYKDSVSQEATADKLGTMQGKCDCGEVEAGSEKYYLLENTSPSKYPDGTYISDNVPIIISDESCVQNPLGVSLGSGEMKCSMNEGGEYAGYAYFIVYDDDNEGNTEDDGNEDEDHKTYSSAGVLPDKLRFLFPIPDGWDIDDVEVEFEYTDTSEGISMHAEFVESIEYRLYGEHRRFIKVVDKDYQPAQDERVIAFVAVWSDYYGPYHVYDKYTDADAFDDYKQAAKGTADAMAQEGDSEAIKALIANAKNEIDAIEYDENKSLDQNKAAVDRVIAQLESDLADHRFEYTATFVDENGEPAGIVKFTIDTVSIKDKEPAVPVKPGYEVVWADYTLAASDMVIPAEYTAITYTATFVDENGAVIGTDTFIVEDTELDEPAVPEKPGYTAAWEEYTIGAGDMTIKPVYTPDDICPLDNEYHGESFWGRLVKFFHTVIFRAFALVGLNIFFKIS